MSRITEHDSSAAFDVRLNVFTVRPPPLEDYLALMHFEDFEVAPLDFDPSGYVVTSHYIDKIPKISVCRRPAGRDAPQLNLFRPFTSVLEISCPKDDAIEALELARIFASDYRGAIYSPYSNRILAANLFTPGWWPDYEIPLGKLAIYEEEKQKLLKRWQGKIPDESSYEAMASNPSIYFSESGHTIREIDLFGFSIRGDPK